MSRLNNMNIGAPFIFIPLLSFTQTATLSLKLTKGETYSQVSKVTSTVIQQVDDKDNTLTTTMGGKTTFLITGVNDSFYNAKVKYARIDMKMEMPGGSMEFDSDDAGKSDMFSTVMRKLVNKPFSIDMTKAGRVMKVEGIDAIISHLLDDVPSLGEQQKQQLSAQLAKSYGEKAFVGSFNMITAIYPVSPEVKKGDKWNIKTQLQSSLPAIYDVTYELVNITDEHYEIRGLGKMTATDTAYTTVNEMPVRYNASGDVTTEFKVSKKTGWISEGKIKQSMSGNMEFKDTAQVPGGLLIPMSFVNETVVTDH
jgi:hypothetical protein